MPTGRTAAIPRARISRKSGHRPSVVVSNRKELCPPTAASRGGCRDSGTWWPKNRPLYRDGGADWDVGAAPPPPHTALCGNHLTRAQRAFCSRVEFVHDREVLQLGPTGALPTLLSLRPRGPAGRRTPRRPGSDLITPAQDLGDVVTIERARPGGHFVEDTAESPDVRPAVSGLPLGLIRAHVRRRAENDTLLCRGRGHRRLQRSAWRSGAPRQRGSALA